MNLQFFLGIVVAVALGVYIGNHPERVREIIETWGLSLFLIILILLGAAGIILLYIFTNEGIIPFWIFLLITIPILALGTRIEIKKAGGFEKYKAQWKLPQREKRILLILSLAIFIPMLLAILTNLVLQR